MDFNTFLLRFGLDPNRFVNRPCEVIQTHNGLLYEVYEKDDQRLCPRCNSKDSYVHQRKPIHLSITTNSHQIETLRIYRVRYRCNHCTHTFTAPLKGMDPHRRISCQVETMICADFYQPYPFSQIAQKYNLSVSTVVRIFDQRFSFVPRKEMPEVLCIDEKKFCDGEEGKYCCILYDYLSKDVVDVLPNRRLAYLKEYFASIPVKERERVRFFVSDMYDGYATIHDEYFPKSVHIIDLFHIVRTLTSAVNSIRVACMNKLSRNSASYRFMKKHWKLFLCRKENIPDRFYSVKRNGEIIHYDDILFDCLKYSPPLLTAYNILQDFYHYYLKNNYQQALDFVTYMIKRLNDSEQSVLIKAAQTFKKWQTGIANSISRSQNRIHYSNSAAENNNTHIETLIRISYGYANFDRFRRRILLIRTYKKP